MVPKRTQGMTILEVLIALLIFIFVILGFMKGISDLMLYLKASKINSRAKELAEKLRSEILNNRTYTDIQNCLNPTRVYNLQLISTDNETLLTIDPTLLTIDTPDLYTENCPFSNGTCEILNCVYCYTGEELISSNNTPCVVGYPIRVGYNSVKIINEFGYESGLAIGLKVYFAEPKTKRKKEINLLVFKKYE